MGDKLTKAEAGRIGGKQTAAKYGSKYMAEIGRRGARSFWARYALKPAGTSNYAIVERATGQIINFTTGGR